jgi:DNA repair protein RadA/Sms
MSKSKNVYICQKCGHSHSKWVGQCSDCGAWNSLVEEVVQQAKRGVMQPLSAAQQQKIVTTFSQVEATSDAFYRVSTTIPELDRVLGKTSQNKHTYEGLVSGAVILVGGEPGVGKSTLLTQVAVALSLDGKRVLYVCGEESPSQVLVRIRRLFPALTTTQLDSLEFVTSTMVEEIVGVIRSKKPDLVIIDSIQTVRSELLSGAAGSVGQIREAAEQLTTVAKEIGTSMFLVGHVTKEGEIAGPKVLEHIVDTVLELSGDRKGDVRLLRAAKNRFGPTDEVGVFQMTELGYQGVANPSQFFIEHREKPLAGSATICVLEGMRPLLIEIQALVVRTKLAMPRRVGRGVELAKLHIVTAILQKHARMPLDSYDVFVSVAGGFRVTEPAIDLGLAMALASSVSERPLRSNTVCIGELGLLGEVRGVSYLERRIKEAQRLGFEHIISRENTATILESLKKEKLMYSK